jgi:hypothetical protein
MNTNKFLAPSILLLTACATTSMPRSDGSNVALGQEAMVDGPVVKPIAVLEDSRCPMNALCVWAGRVRLKMLWIRSKGNREFELTLGEPKPLADGSITLTSVRPDKRTDVILKPSDYRFSFSFAGGL